MESCKLFLIKKFLMLVFFIIILTSINGCSMIGLGIGAMCDTETPDTSVISKDKIAGIIQGKTIQANLRNGSKITGTFKGIEQFTLKQYSQLYETAQQKISDFYLPSLDKISVYEKNGNYKSAFLLRGFCNRGFVAADTAYFNQRLIGFNVLSEYFLVDRKGKYLDMPLLKEHILRGDIPDFFLIKIDTASSPILLNLADISNVIIINKRNAAITGLLVGAALDAAIVIYLIKNPPSFDFNFKGRSF